MLLGASILLLAATALPPERADYVMSQLLQNGFSREEAEAFFQDPRLKLYPPQQVQPRAVDWDQVIANLVAPKSVQQGVDFMARYQETLTSLETQFGVDKSLLTALLRLESNFGKNVGNYVTFNVFYTFLSQQQEERRWRFAGDNLVALAVFCKKMGSDCFQFRGSYAGALGAAQFLPYSIEQFGADGNSDGVINPFEMEDAIMSAGNFLVLHGYAEDQAQALAKYYGTSVGYPRAVFAYAEALKKAAPAAQPSADLSNPSSSQ